ncbi:hypothetical protein [uncultured Sphingomonas sp.]|uniref:hypothetical protein n=1 Tax=uncultured Sphingomonas sp. TaxID=158754 RepID=UPI0035CA5F38
MMRATTVPMALMLGLAAPAVAKWTEVAAARTPVAGSTLSVAAGAGWNRWSKHPIKAEELWSLDGPLLNQIVFLGGVADGQPIAREPNRKREPLPHFAAAMRPTDIAELLERTTRITEAAPDFTTEAVAPATFAGRPGFRLRYRYTVGELTRLGEARGAVIDGRLYLIAYSAPALHYFDTDLPRATAIMDSAQVG